MSTATPGNTAMAPTSITALLIASLMMIASLFSQQTQAEEQKFYTVEMIIIKHLVKTDEETWPNSIQLSYPQQKKVFLNDGKNPAPAGLSSLRVDGAASHTNTKLADRVRGSRDFRVMYHQSWTQHIKDQRSAQHLVIQAGDPVDGVYPIAGSLKLFKGRYLHLRSNLWFVDFNEDITALEAAPYQSFLPEANDETDDNNATMAPQEDGEPEEQGLVEGIWPIPPSAASNSDEQLWSANIQRISQIQQKRRMRSSEVHYIDHPLYGIIIEIRPYNN